MVVAVRSGQSLRSVARQFGVSLATVQLWVNRASGQSLERINWEDRSHTPHSHPKQTPAQLEQGILDARIFLGKNSDLGELGAKAIQSRLLGLNNPAVPSTATINRILEKNGVFDKTRRVRRKPPLPGWYVPEIALKLADIDETDYVEGLYLEGGEEVFLLNTISLHGGLCASGLTHHQVTDYAIEGLLAHWRVSGLPAYAQFDNGNVFTGPQQHADTIGRVIRTCLSLEVTPVFAVPREFGIQSAVESYNNRWQQKVWSRFTFSSFEEAEARSARYVQAVNQKSGARQEAAPLRRSFPENWKGATGLTRKGKILFIRRTNMQGAVVLLGNEYLIAKNWLNRLVRCEVDLTEDKIRVYGLRRAEPESQPLLNEWEYRLPDKSKKKERQYD